MLSRSTHTRPLLIAIAIAAVGCNSKKENTATATSGPSAQQSAAPASSAAPIGSAPVPDASASAQKDAGPPEWYACTKPQDCAVVRAGKCCGPCDPFNFEGNYTAVNIKFKAELAAHQGCADVKCPQCPPEQPDYPRTSANFFALCEEKRCVAVDLRFSKYEACKTAKDCVFRFGLGCCEGCGDHDLVTYNPASGLDRDVCPQKPKCPPVSAQCRSYRHYQQPPECALDRCQLSD